METEAASTAEWHCGRGRGWDHGSWACSRSFVFRSRHRGRLRVGRDVGGSADPWSLSSDPWQRGRFVVDDWSGTGRPDQWWSSGWRATSWGWDTYEPWARWSSWSTRPMDGWWSHQWGRQEWTPAFETWPQAEPWRVASERGDGGGAADAVDRKPGLGDADHGVPEQQPAEGRGDVARKQGGDLPGTDSSWSWYNDSPLDESLGRNPAAWPPGPWELHQLDAGDEPSTTSRPTHFDGARGRGAGVSDQEGSSSNVGNGKAHNNRKIPSTYPPSFSASSDESYAQWKRSVQC